MSAWSRCQAQVVRRNRLLDAQEALIVGCSILALGYSATICSLQRLQLASLPQRDRIAAGCSKGRSAVRDVEWCSFRSPPPGFLGQGKQPECKTRVHWLLGGGMASQPWATSWEGWLLLGCTGLETECVCVFFCALSAIQGSVAPQS